MVPVYLWYQLLPAPKNRSTLLWTGGVSGVLMDSSSEHLCGGKNRFGRFISGKAELF